jgi:hypothetical protein
MQMPEAMQFDADVSRQLEAAYLTADIVEQRRLQLAALDLEPGENVLDIGSGPGLLAEQAAAIARYDIAPGSEPPPGDPRERDLDFWRALHLLREHKRGLAGIGKEGRPPTRASEGQLAASLMRLLDKCDRRRARRADYRL